MRRLDRAKRWAKAVKRDVVALWLAARDPRTPLQAKIVAGIVAAYALSPIDLIPDFIPILGYLDDLVLVPLGILAAVALIPPPLMREFRAEAQGRADRPKGWAGTIAIMLVWIALLAVATWMARPLISRMFAGSA